jgi:hypothetical protein
MAQLRATDTGRAARQGRLGRLLDLHLHQLAPAASLPARLGREIRWSRAGGDRRPHPEFSFEHNPGNVRRAVQDLRITYPVATDNNYGVWRAFDNHYWPALYFADAQGNIRHHHLGEGEYAQSEMVIQQLLAEAGPTGAGTDVVSVDAQGLEAPADWATLGSRKTTPAMRVSTASPPPAARCRASRTSTPSRRGWGLNQWALSETGPWKRKRPR